MTRSTVFASNLVDVELPHEREMPRSIVVLGGHCVETWPANGELAP